MLDHEMRFAVTLIYANKSDLPHALSNDEVAAEVRIDLTSSQLEMARKNPRGILAPFLLPLLPPADIARVLPC